MRSVDSSELKNKRIIVRVDFNVPIINGAVEDDARILAVKQTLDHLLKHNNRLILISYLGRPEKREQKFSLRPVVARLKELFPQNEVVFIDDFLADDIQVLSQSNDQILLFENIRFYPQEKSNDTEYIRKIASYADVFVNDAFSVSHRKEATVTGLPQLLPSYAGFQLMKEVNMLKKALGSKGRPRVTILGGAKVSTKIQLIEKFIDSSDYVLLGGALANTFLAAKGKDMGKSLYEKEHIETANFLIEKAENGNCTMLLPSDFTTNEAESILDIGPETIRKYKDIITKAHTIIWNGPMGYYEDPAYRAGSDSIFYAIAANPTALSIIGGGDTLLILENKSKEALSHISHVSTGGGAMLEFIENGSLPGIDALTP